MLLSSDDFRAMAQDALRGKWVSAALIGLLAGLLGANIFGDFSLTFETRYSKEIERFLHSDLWLHYQIFFIIGGGVLAVYALVMLVISGAATLGYARYNLNLVDHQEARVDDLFSQFHRLGQGFCMQFFRALFIFLWSLLFVIPGIIASYRYRFALYNLCENPEMSAMEALRMSKVQTNGYKMELFMLDLSFLGWSILCSLTAGILAIWVSPWITQTDIGYFEEIKRIKGVGRVYNGGAQEQDDFHRDERF